MVSKNILVVSNPEDEHTSHVVKLINDLGGNPILFYPEKLGTELTLSLAHYPEKNVSHHSSNGDEIAGWATSEIYSIWYRRPRSNSTSLKKLGLSQEGVEFARNEWKSTLEGLYALMQDKLWVSHPDKLLEAARKPLQLHIARALGLNTPRTLVTNQSDKANKFYELCGGKVIVKAIGHGWVYSENGEELHYVMTNRINSADLESESEMKIAPVIFQEEIPKAYEIRTNIVGQSVLSIKIDSQKSEISKVDWRRYDISNTPYSSYKLPSSVEKKCLQLTHELGLEFGAIDLIRTPDGKYVFLEINGNGQFLWAEELSGMKVSNALANLLAGKTPPLKSMNFS